MSFFEKAKASAAKAAAATKAGATKAADASKRAAKKLKLKNEVDNLNKAIIKEKKTFGTAAFDLLVAEDMDSTKKIFEETNHRVKEMQVKIVDLQEKIAQLEAGVDVDTSSVASSAPVNDDSD